MTGASGYDRETSLRIHASETGLVPSAVTLWIQSSVGTLLALLPSFSSPPHVLSICPSPFYHIQASYLLHDGGLRWEKGQLAAAACRWVLCCSWWKERKHPKENEKLQGV